jgi:hypothetical protein
VAAVSGSDLDIAKDDSVLLDFVLDFVSLDSKQEG